MGGSLKDLEAKIVLGVSTGIVLLGSLMVVLGILHDIIIWLRG